MTPEQREKFNDGNPIVMVKNKYCNGKTKNEILLSW
jgi:hypothetical protein